MRVSELIEALGKMDSKAPVMLWSDGWLYDLTDVKQINPDQARIEHRHKHTVTLS